MEDCNLVGTRYDCVVAYHGGKMRISASVMVIREISVSKDIEDFIYRTSEARREIKSETEVRPQGEPKIRPTQKTQFHSPQKIQKLKTRTLSRKSLSAVNSTKFRMSQPTLASLSEQLTKLSASVTSQMKEINDVYTQMAKLTVTPEPEKCCWCRGDHAFGKCHHNEFMDELNAFETETEGIFKAQTYGDFWVFAFPINKYPILIGYCRAGFPKIFNLDFFAGMAYGKTGLPEPEIFTKHEFQVIKDHDPALAAWIINQNIRTVD